MATHYCIGSPCWLCHPQIRGNSAAFLIVDDPHEVTHGFTVTPAQAIEMVKDSVKRESEGQ